MIHPHLTKEQSEQAVRLWRSGLDTFQIAIALKVSEAAVYNSLRDARTVCRRAS